MKNRLNSTLSSITEPTEARILIRATNPLLHAPRKFLPLLLMLFLFITGSASAQIITTIAGNGTGGYSGDGGPATLAKINNAAAVAVDGGGNVYISDGSNNRIRKVNPFGIISTFAGNGTAGDSGDGGQATAAELRAGVLAFDGSGNLYIAEGYPSNRVRKVNTSGIISTVAGNGGFGHGGDGGQATAAAIFGPNGIAFDGSGNMYVSEAYGHTIRKINTSGIISTIAGNGTGGNTGDGGPATAAELNFPDGLVVDGSGNLYVVEYVNETVRKINTSGIISKFAGNGSGGFSGDGGPATAAKLNNPIGIGIGGGNIYIADWYNQRIRKVSISSGIISTVAGGGGGGDGSPATAAALSSPFGVAVDGSGNIYIADIGEQRIRKVGNSPFPLPTLSQWSLIIFTLLLLSVGIVLLVKQRTGSLAIAGAANAQVKPSLFDRSLYFKALGGIMLLAVAGLLASYRYFGSLTLADTLGTIASAFIVAFIVQLSLLMKRK